MTTASALIASSDLLILATGRVPAELRAEFGDIPIAALPLAGVPLLWWVLDELNSELRAASSAVLVLDDDAQFLLRPDDFIQLLVVPTSGSTNHLEEVLSGIAGYSLSAVTVVVVNLPGSGSPTTAMPTGGVSRLLNADLFTTTDPAAFLAQLRSEAVDVNNCDELRYSSVVSSGSITSHGAAAGTCGRSACAYFATQLSALDTHPQSAVTAGPTPWSVRKNGSDNDKINAEIQWFKNIPAGLSHFAPELLGEGRSEHSTYYDLEFLAIPTIADLFVFGGHGSEFWRALLSKVGLCGDALHQHRFKTTTAVMAAANHQMYVTKTVERLQMLKQHRGWSLPEELWSGPVLNGRNLPGIEEVERRLESRYQRSTLAEPRDATIIHGDYHLGNLFYDLRYGRVRAIDPRGSFGGLPGLFGDPMYDELKLAHDILGHYSHVRSDLFILEQDGDLFNLRYTMSPAAEAVSALSAGWVSGRVADSYGIASTDLRLGVSLLLLSLAALHSATPLRQQAHLLRGLELFAEVSDA